MSNTDPRKRTTQSTTSQKRLNTLFGHMHVPSPQPHVLLERANIPQNQWKLPVAFSKDGEKEINLLDWVTAKPDKILALNEVTADKQKRLVIDRINLQEDFDLHSIGEIGTITKERAIEEVRHQTPIGKQLQRIEMRVIDKIVTRLNK